MLDQKTLDEMKMIDESSEDEDGDANDKNLGSKIDKPPRNDRNNCKTSLMNNETQETTQETETKMSDKESMLFIIRNCFSLVLYLVDVFSDLILAGKYFHESEFGYAIGTLFFYLLSSIIVTSLSSRRLRELPLKSTKNVFTYLTIVALNFEPALCYLRCIDLKRNGRMMDRYCDIKLRGEENNVASMRLYEGCAESVPQLVLQLSIVLAGNAADAFQCIALASSLVGLLATVSVYYGSLAADQRMEILPGGYAMLLAMHLLWFVSRFGSVSLGASAYPATLAVPAVHWAVLGAWETARSWRYPGAKAQKAATAAVEACVASFCPWIVYASVNLFVIHTVAVLAENAALSAASGAWGACAAATACGVAAALLNAVWKYFPNRFAAVKGTLAPLAFKWIDFYSELTRQSSGR